MRNASAYDASDHGDLLEGSTVMVRVTPCNVRAVSGILSSHFHGAIMRPFLPDRETFSHKCSTGKPMRKLVFMWPPLPKCRAESEVPSKLGPPIVLMRVYAFGISVSCA
jgi:hypothetical protein